MRMLTFSKRNAKEILRDPLNIAFGLGFPVILIFLLSAIQANIPVPLFEIERLAPGICIFGLSFMTLFSSLLLAKDRESALLQRLYTTPLKGSDFIFGYILPLIPIAVLQSVICYFCGIVLGMKTTVNILYALIFIVPVSVFYISLGLLCGSFLNSKQVGGVCGALLTNLSAFLSGIWFDVELVGGAFKKFAYSLPFIHAVELERTVYNGDFGAALPHLIWVIAYTAITTILAVILFLRQMKKQ